MLLDKSPSLEAYQSGIPAKLPDPYQRRKRIILLACLFVLVSLAGGVAYFLKSGQAAALAGRGSLTGTVVDSQSRPVQAEIFTSDDKLLTQTNDAGHFQLDNLPAGQNSVVIAYQYLGQTYTVQIQAGQITDMGQIIARGHPALAQ